MYQDIVLSPNFLSSIGVEQRNRLFELFSILGTERLLTDANGSLEGEYWEAVRNSRASEALLPIWTYFRTCSRFCPQAGVVAEQRQLDDLTCQGTELQLADRDTCRLVLCLIKQVAREAQEEAKQRRIEMVDWGGYMKPQPTSRVRGRRSLELKKGAHFDLCRWIAKHISDATSVKIVDPYVGDEPGWSNLRTVLKHVPNDARLEVWTLEDGVRGMREHRRFEVEELVQKGYPKSRRTYFAQETQIVEGHDRWIKTNRFLILMGFGLGCVSSARVVAQGTTMTVSLLEDLQIVGL